jgi:hypothetical protein
MTERYQTRLTFTQTSRNVSIIELLKQLKIEKQQAMYIERAIALQIAVDSGVIEINPTVRAEWKSMLPESLDESKLSKTTQVEDVINQPEKYREVQSAHTTKEVHEDSPVLAIKENLISDGSNIELIPNEVEKEVFTTSLSIL